MCSSGLIKRLLLVLVVSRIGVAIPLETFSAQTEEWWRWVLVRITAFSEFITVGPNETGRDAFVEEWQPDLFDWAGDGRWLVGEWARLRGIATAVEQELEYEEAQFWCNVTEPNIVNETWGMNGFAVDIYGKLAPFTGASFAPYMTHAAPNWHTAVAGGNARNGRAAIGESMAQDNACVFPLSRSDTLASGWAFGPWEEKRFLDQYGQKLRLNATFSIRQYVAKLIHLPPPLQPSRTCQPQMDTTGAGHDVIGEVGAPDAATCCTKCGQLTGCETYTFYQGVCYLSNASTLSYDSRALIGGSCSHGACAPAVCSRCDRAPPPPSPDLVQDPIFHAFVEFTYLLWRDAWRDNSLTTKAAAKQAGLPTHATYGNLAYPAPNSIIQAPWHDVWWMEGAWDPPCILPPYLPSDGPLLRGGGTTLQLKLAQAAMRGAQKSEVVWIVGGLRCDGEQSSAARRATRVYLAENIANNVNDWLLEGYTHSDWRNTKEAKNLVQLVTASRWAFVDRTRIADGAIVYCLSCLLWRSTGPFAPQDGSGQHSRHLAVITRLLEDRHQLYEMVVLGHPKFFNATASTIRVLPPSEGGYKWLFLPNTDAMSDDDVVLLSAYVRGGGRLILSNSAKEGCGTRDEELAPRSEPALKALQEDPGKGAVFVIDTAKFEAYAGCSSGSCEASQEALWDQVAPVMHGPARRLKEDRAHSSLILEGLPQSTYVNMWRHGAGDMLSVHLVNYANTTVPAFNITVASFPAVKHPVARLLSLDHSSSTPIALPVTLTSEGGLLVTVSTMIVHSIVVFASSEAELEARSSAAVARMWLQRAVLASRSRGLQQLKAEGRVLPNVTAPLIAADQLLSQVQGPSSVQSGDEERYRALQGKLVNASASLKKAMQQVRSIVEGAEAKQREEALEMCAGTGSCLKAFSFGPSSALPPASGFRTVEPDSLYQPALGYGFVNEGAPLHDKARTAFSTAALPDGLHGSGIFSAYRSVFRVDVDLSGTSTLPSTLLLSILSGVGDIGSPYTSHEIGEDLPTGSCSGTACGGFETRAWMSFASTALGVQIRPLQVAGNVFPSPLPFETSSCMLGERGLTPGYWQHRACRLNISRALKVSRKLQIDIALAPDAGMTGCWGAQCGRIAKAWLLNSLVLQLPDSQLPSRARTSLRMADRVAASAVRDWWWCGPFSDHGGQGFDLDGYEIEAVVRQTRRPPLLNQSYTGKDAQRVGWHQYTAPAESTAPFLPLSRLLPTRQLKVGSVAFALAHVWCASSTGCKKVIRGGMSDRGKLWLVSPSGSASVFEVLSDEIISGLSATELQAEVILHAGWNVLLAKTVSTFAADTVAVNGSRAAVFGSEGGDGTWNGIGLLRAENEWGIHLNIEDADGSVSADEVFV